MTRSGPEDILPTYRRVAARWHDQRPRVLFEAPWLERFRSALPRPGGTVLDLGCGTGQPIAAWLAGAGCRVTGVDGAEEMIAILSREVPEAVGVVADMRALDLGRRFDGILAWDSLFHLSMADQRAIFAVLAAHAAPGAALMFTSGPAAGEAWGRAGEEEVYHASLSPAEYRRCLAAAGFEVLAFVPEDPDCDRHSVWLARRVGG